MHNRKCPVCEGVLGKGFIVTIKDWGKETVCSECASLVRSGDITKENMEEVLKIRESERNYRAGYDHACGYWD